MVRAIILLTLVATSLLATTAFAEPIHTAAANGNFAGVQAELQKGVDVNAKDEAGNTPLHWAVFKGNKEVAELLIAKGADVNARDVNGTTPLRWTHEGSKEIAELLIAKGADVNAKDEAGNTPLHWAVFKGNKEVAELLIAKGADVNAKDDNGKTLLDWAEIKKHSEIASLLRLNGGKFGITDLIMESLHGLASSMSHGHELTDEQHKILRQKQEQLVDGHIGISILVAARYGDIRAVKQHLEVGTDVNKKDYLEHEWTPLHLAAGSGHKEIVKLLIDNGADVNAKSDHDWTPLHSAARDANKEIYELLKSNGADVNARNDSGRTPLDLAGSPAVVGFVLSEDGDSFIVPDRVYRHGQAYDYFSAPAQFNQTYDIGNKPKTKQSKPGNTNENKNNIHWAILIVAVLFILLVCAAILDWRDGAFYRPGYRIVGAVTRPMDDSDSDCGGDFGGMM